jgi:hypothetical protein
MAVARRCQGCGSSLPEVEEGSTVVTCPFCGLAHDDAVGPSPVVVRIGGEAQRRAGRRIGWVILTIVLISTIVTLVPVWFSVRFVREVSSRTTSMLPSQRRADARATLVPAELAAVPQGQGWKALEVPPPPGGFADFDPVAGIPWATSIGRAWAADAVLSRVDVGRVAVTGAVDLSGEDASGYRFASPARHRQWTNETDAGSKSLTATGLMLLIKGTEVRALATEDRGDPAAPPPPESLALREILERARRNRGFTEKPYYSGYLIHLPREGWVWYFRAISGDGSFPRVRARDGRVYPY